MGGAQTSHSKGLQQHQMSLIRDLEKAIAIPSAQIGALSLEGRVLCSKGRLGLEMISKPLANALSAARSAADMAHLVVGAVDNINPPGIRGLDPAS
jgi:hypothetical protein